MLKISSFSKLLIKLQIIIMYIENIDNLIIHGYCIKEISLY